MRAWLHSLVLLVCAGSAQAQMYKWIGPDGKVNYTDTPPPPAAKQVEKKDLGESDVAVGDLPYAVAEVARNFPVTLYTGIDCLPCDDGRKLLASRGIPFREKTVKSNDDIVQFRQAGGNDQLPMLLVGSNKQEGFSRSGWNDALTAVGYPQTSALPKTYRNPAAEAAAPQPAPRPQAGSANGGNAAPPAAPAEPPPASGNAPPGFRF